MSAHTRNLYADLRSKPSDDLATIKSNFRAIVRETHSDANGGSDEHRQTFERAVQAWSVLGEPVRREAWIKRRTEWLAEQGAVECSGCGSGVRIVAFRNVRCPNCKTVLSISDNHSGADWAGRVYQPFVSSGRRITEQLVDATESEAERLGRELVNESAKILGELIAKGFRSARRRIRGD